MGTEERTERFEACVGVPGADAAPEPHFGRNVPSASIAPRPVIAGEKVPGRHDASPPGSRDAGRHPFGSLLASPIGDEASPDFFSVAVQSCS